MQIFSVISVLGRCTKQSSDDSKEKKKRFQLYIMPTPQGTIGEKPIKRIARPGINVNTRIKTTIVRPMWSERPH